MSDLSQAQITLPGRFVDLPDGVSELDFQTEAIAFGIQCKRVLYPLPTGTGKTYIALKVWHGIGAQKVLVLCSGNALYTWKKNIARHLPDVSPRTVIISKMDAMQRQKVYNDPDVSCIVIRFKTYAHDVPLFVGKHYDLVIGDEQQKFLRNHKSKQYKEAIFPLYQRCSAAIGLTAHPVSKGRQEYWPTLHAFYPRRFASYWQFVNQFTIVARGMFGMEILGPRNTIQFREQVKNIIFSPSMPISGLPKVNRSTMPIEMTSAQARMYHKLYEDMYVELTGGGVIITSNILAKITRLRQILCCPAILDPEVGLGAGIEAILDHIDEDDDRKHAIIGVPFTHAIPYIGRALRDAGYGKIVVFQAGMELDDLAKAETEFRDDPNSVAVCSILYSQSFELETGFPLYFLGYDWDPFNNAQLEGRAARLTTERPSIPAYYVHHLGTYDDRLLEVNGNKVSNTKVDATKVSDIKMLVHTLK